MYLQHFGHVIDKPQILFEDLRPIYFTRKYTNDALFGFMACCKKRQLKLRLIKGKTISWSLGEITVRAKHACYNPHHRKPM